MLRIHTALIVARITLLRRGFVIGPRTVVINRAIQKRMLVEAGPRTRARATAEVLYSGSRLTNTGIRLPRAAARRLRSSCKLQRGGWEGR